MPDTRGVTDTHEHAELDGSARDQPSPRRRRIVRREAIRERWAVMLVLFVWGWWVGPRLLLTLTAPKSRSSVGEVSAGASPYAALALTVSTWAVLGLCALIVMSTIRDPHPGHLAGLVVMLAPWLYLVVRDMFAQDRPTAVTLVFPAVVVALWILRPRLQLLAVLGLLCGISVLIAIVLGLAVPSKGIFHFDTGDLVIDDKATLPMGILVGYLTHGNSMGIATVLSLPLIFLVKKEWARAALLYLVPTALARPVFIGLAVFALFWSASRSSWGAAAVGLIAFAVIKVMPLNLRRPLGPIVALVPFALVATLPWVTHDPTAFTNRGFIWSSSLEYWRLHPFAGWGANFYDTIGQTSDRIAATAFHGHNQMVQLLVTGGVVVVVLVGLVIIACAVRAGRFAEQGHVVGVVYLATLAGASLLEKPFSVVDNYGTFPVFVLPVALLMFADRSPLLEGDKLWPDVGPEFLVAPSARPGLLPLPPTSRG